MIERELKMLRIRHVLRGRCDPARPDGIVRHTYFLAQAQRQLGHDVAVYGVAASVAAPERVRRDGLEVHAVPRTRNPFGVHPSLRAQMIGPDSDVHIFHLQLPFDPAVWGVGRLLRRLGRPYVVSPHALWSPDMLSRHALRKALYRMLFDRRLATGASAVHATAAEELPDIKRYAPGVPAFALRNALDIDAVRRQARRTDYWRRVFPDIDSREQIAVFLGRLDPYQKGLDVLLPAWARVQQRAPGRGRLALIGPFWRDSEAQLRHLAAASGTGRVAFVGPLYEPEKYEALASADIYVQTSRAETTPYSIQEALACGLPAVVTPGTNFAEAVHNYDAGLASPLDVQQLADTLCAAIFLPKERRLAMSANAVRLVRERHGLDRLARRMVQAYSSLLLGEPLPSDE
jgi:glycosyltransferase involved in cell wall biosynthesis